MGYLCHLVEFVELVLASSDEKEELRSEVL
jgi:hypothetical protein